jgi:hypothetical protein
MLNIEEVGSSGNALDLYSGSDRFGSRSATQVFLVFLSLLRQIPG